MNKGRKRSSRHHLTSNLLPNYVKFESSTLDLRKLFFVNYSPKVYATSNINFVSVPLLIMWTYFCSMDLLLPYFFSVLVTLSDLTAIFCAVTCRAFHVLMQHRRPTARQSASLTSGGRTTQSLAKLPQKFYVACFLIIIT